MIVIEGAERFGLAALHQLRGRVGRGTRPSRCFLICNEATERLAILEHSHNGFRIAEADLIHRCDRRPCMLTLRPNAVFAATLQLVCTASCRPLPRV